MGFAPIAIGLGLTLIQNKHLLLEPVDYKKDLYGFVYAPDRNGYGLYDPFPNASAYHG